MQFLHLVIYASIMLTFVLVGKTKLQRYECTQNRVTFALRYIWTMSLPQHEVFSLLFLQILTIYYEKKLPVFLPYSWTVSLQVGANSEKSIKGTNRNSRKKKSGQSGKFCAILNKKSGKLSVAKIKKPKCNMNLNSWMIEIFLVLFHVKQ